MHTAQPMRPSRTLIAQFRLGAGAMLARVLRQEGQTMTEYAILIGVIALIVVVVALSLGSSISAIFTSASRRL
jgi:Flp pilus assembly pilin Flp